MLAESELKVSIDTDCMKIESLAGLRVSNNVCR